MFTEILYIFSAHWKEMDNDLWICKTSVYFFVPYESPPSLHIIHVDQISRKVKWLICRKL